MVIPITVTGPTEISGGAAAMAGMVVDTMDGEGGMATADWHGEAWCESIPLQYLISQEK